jgi:hypothetical protein
MQDDVYSGYDDGTSALSETSPVRPLDSSRGRTPGTRGGTALRQGRLGSAMGRTAVLSSARAGTAVEGSRPVTAVKGAGYVSTSSSSLGRKQDSSGFFSRQQDPSPTEQITALEVAVHELLETAVELLQKGEANSGMPRALLLCSDSLSHDDVHCAYIARPLQLGKQHRRLRGCQRSCRHVQKPLGCKTT